jgi:hypothetical protein
MVIAEDHEIVDQVERFARSEGAGTNEIHRIMIARELLAP